MSYLSSKFCPIRIVDDYTNLFHLDRVPLTETTDNAVESAVQDQTAHTCRLDHALHIPQNKSKVTNSKIRVIIMGDYFSVCSEVLPVFESHRRQVRNNLETCRQGSRSISEGMPQHGHHVQQNCWRTSR